jgi:hypothetical protein
MGVGYDFNERFWSELTFSGMFADVETENWYENNIPNMSANLSAKYNIIAKKQHDIYLGLGVLLDFYDMNAFFMTPVGLRIRPFEKMNNIAFQIEIQPATDGSMYLFGNVGIHYHF